MYNPKTVNKNNNKIRMLSFFIIIYWTSVVILELFQIHYGDIPFMMYTQFIGFIDIYINCYYKLRDKQIDDIRDVRIILYIFGLFGIILDLSIFS